MYLSKKVRLENVDYHSNRISTLVQIVETKKLTSEELATIIKNYQYSGGDKHSPAFCRYQFRCFLNRTDVPADPRSVLYLYECSRGDDLGFKMSATKSGSRLESGCKSDLTVHLAESE